MKADFQERRFSKGIVVQTMFTLHQDYTPLPPGDAAPGGAIYTSLHRQRCELSEEAARLWFLDGKLLGLFSTRQ